MKLAPGKNAPDFTLCDKDDVEVSLKRLKCDYTVIFFYPKDNTPGCTIQSKEYSKDLRHFRKLNATVIGISGGDNKSKAAFCKKYKLEVPLLSDSDFSTAKKYGVYGEKSFMGKKFLGIFRTTFLLDKNKKVIKVYEAASPETNSSDVISDIKALTGGKKTGSKASTAKKKVTLKNAKKKVVVKKAKRSVTKKK